VYNLQVREQLEQLQKACQEAHASQGIINLLRAVLSAGNHLNNGTFKGQASGTELGTCHTLHTLCSASMVWQSANTSCLFTETHTALHRAA